MRKQLVILTLLLVLFSQMLYAVGNDSVSCLVTPHYAPYNNVPAPSKKAPSKIKKYLNEEFTRGPLGLIATGFIIKGNRREYQNIRHHFVPSFENKYDDYLQYSPAVATYLLKIAGVENRSSWPRMVTSTVFSYATMALIVNSMKHSINEMRPDGSTANSFPSGHTATAFVSATILHKEYGAKSPWYSFAGYSMATVTGVTRILNNRHWISDVLVGAGVGILSTDLGYLFADLIFKEKGIKRVERTSHKIDIAAKPSFVSFGVQMGIEPKSLNVPNVYDNYDANLKPTTDAKALNMRLKLGLSSSVALEGAYFFNEHWGIGGRFRAKSIPVISETSPEKGFDYGIGSNPLLDGAKDFCNLESGRLSMFNLSLGGYYSYPLSSSMALGTKFLIGNKITTDYEVAAVYNTSDKTPGNDFIVDNEFLKIDADHSLVFSTGLSFTYAHDRGLVFRLSLDYDSNSPEYVYKLYNRVDGKGERIEDVFKEKTRMDSFSAGLSMAIHF